MNANNSLLSHSRDINPTGAVSLACCSKKPHNAELPLVHMLSLKYPTALGSGLWISACPTSQGTSVGDHGPKCTPFLIDFLALPYRSHECLQNWRRKFQ